MFSILGFSRLSTGERVSHACATLRVTGFVVVLCAFCSPVFGADVGEAMRVLDELTVAAEQRCSPYQRSRHYSYPQSVEPLIVEQLGGIYGPYTGACFESIYETDIEHIVAASEAHDSGLCAVSPAVRSQFASDLRNLTLASPAVNRGKSGKDAGEWQPPRNRCWFAARVIAVRSAYSLTIDASEKAALSSILSQCDSTALKVFDCRRPAVLVQYDNNKNGHISCKEARAHGIAPVSRDHPAYAYMTDGDNDGKVCE